MSTSPKRRYYDSKPASRPISPPTPAEVRSLAIAKLKRAASLPRNKDGRRPTPSPSPSPAVQTETFVTPQSFSDNDDYFADAPSAQEGARQQGHGVGAGDDAEEVLSPSPTNPTFDHAGIYRSNSQTSEFHLPTPPIMSYSHPNGNSYANSPAYGSSSASTPDWSAMHLALPSLSPAGLSPSPFGSHPRSSRNTPSPLPTLGDLRTLQRSNSAMARARAMDKLTGGRDVSPVPPPSARDDMTLGPASGFKLQRSGTVGPRVLEKQADAVEELAPDLPKADTPPSRPRLQRSFTVSSTNMGEERRSAVGRRMVERLAERRAARDKQEAEVRQMWEEKRAAAEQVEQRPKTPDPQPGHIENEVPIVHRSSPAEPPAEQMPHGVTFGQTESHTLGVPDRPISRETMRSNGGPFEYDSHLRRSLSSRTARGAVGVISSDTETDPIPPVKENHVEQLDRQYASPSPSYAQDDMDLTPPRPTFVTPSRHIAQSSTSTASTIQAGQSPGSDSSQSRDALNSMMFVMGRGSQGNELGNRPESSWPHGVEDGGSTDWGTPSRGLEIRTPGTRSPLIHDTPESSHPTSAIISEYDTENSPNPNHPVRESVMSWEEVGGGTDLEVPSDTQYHKKSGSVSAKFGRSVKTALRKRSQSRSSADSGNTPASPRGLGEAITNAVQHFSRRGSASSTSPAFPTAAQMSHQPSMSSLSPSLARSDSISNSQLLQHEGPTHEWMPRRANPDDPRIASSKMSPFPGIAALEERGRAGTAGSTELGTHDGPKLIHQASDSVVPTQQRTQQVEPIYAMPLPNTGPITGAEVSRRESTDSAKKRSWLTKAFTSPRSSGSMSRKSSTQEISPILDDKSTTQVPTSAGLGPDPFAAPPLPAPAPVRKISTSRATASPSVSIVHEANEDRLTRYTATPIGRRGEDNTTPVPGGSVGGQQSKEALKRVDDMLAMGPDDPARPEILDDPPRKLLSSTQVLQVVNTHTAKDRFLYLFNDVLVITKPLINQGTQATLDMKYIVKSVVPLEQLQISGFEPESTDEPPRHAIVNTFINKFATNSRDACRYLVERSANKFDAATLAALLFKTPELDGAQLGLLLGGNERLLHSFIDRFHFTGVRIDQALRIFLLSIRMPNDPNHSEDLLRGFATRYFDANRDIVSYDEQLAAELVLAIIQLNDALYGTFGFALPNRSITKEVFISAFHSKDPRALVNDDLLAGIYDSIRSRALDQALSSRAYNQARDVIVTPSRYQTRLTYGTWSEPIYISIPQADPSFRIQLLGEGLEFDPPLLDFEQDYEVAFRVRGTSLGSKTMILERTGENAALYSGLGNARTFIIERAFMKHTFQLSFVSHTGMKRKYLYSVPDAQTRSRWAQALHRQIGQARLLRAKQDQNGNELRKVAEAVSLQVLRDALLPPPPSDHPTARYDNMDSKAQGQGHGDGMGKTRQGSVSTTYKHLVSTEEAELGPLQPPRTAFSPDTPQSGLVDVQTGKELVLLCRQNSLLPGLLELLTAGREDMTKSGSSMTTATKGMLMNRGNGNVNGIVNGSGSVGRMDSRKGAMAGRF